MKGLREHVAEAIRTDQERGGAGILTDEEMHALELADLALYHADVKAGSASNENYAAKGTLAAMRHQLGPTPMFIHGEKMRVDDYWLHCADVAIRAYDAWIEERANR